MIRLRPLRILRTNSACSAAISVHAPQPPSPTPPSPSPPWPPPPSPPPPPPSHPPRSPRRHGGRALLGLSCRGFVKQQRPSCKFANWTANSCTQQHNSVTRYELTRYECAIYGSQSQASIRPFPVGPCVECARRERRHDRHGRPCQLHQRMGCPYSQRAEQQPAKNGHLTLRGTSRRWTMR